MIMHNVMCDRPGCPHMKRACNHWFVVSFPENSFIVIEKHSIVNQNRIEQMHACGEACLLKIISEHIKNATAVK
jgi:hypothetical protein